MVAYKSSPLPQCPDVKKFGLLSLVFCTRRLKFAHINLAGKEVALMAQWNPFQEMEVLRREIDRIFDSFGPRTRPVFRTAFLPGRAAREYPLCNLYEDKEAVYVEALAPGVDPA